MEENNQIKKHSICVYERGEVLIEGVIKLDSFDKNEFLINTSKGYLHIKGKDLTLGTMDMDKGTLSINGTVDSFSYLTGTSSTKESFFQRIFK